MGTEPAKDLWAVVFSGGKSYVGNITSGYKVRDSTDLLGGTIALQPCYEIISQLIPMRGPQGQMVVSKNISAEPVIVTFDEASPVHLIPTGFMLFSEMKASDQARYKRLVETAAQMALESRASESGIVAPGTGGNPQRA